MCFFISIVLLLGGVMGDALAEPSPPGLTFLYTSYVNIVPGIDIGATPNGARKAIPITGGNFTGPRLQGTILNLGADWGITGADGIFHADTRYGLKTDDGANIYIRTSGPAQPDGNSHLRMVFETGAANYTWLNNIVAVGVLIPSGLTSDGYVLRIDAWHLEIPTAPAPQG